jgi:hypothetical protein
MQAQFTVIFSTTQVSFFEDVGCLNVLTCGDKNVGKYLLRAGFRSQVLVRH